MKDISDEQFEKLKRRIRLLTKALNEAQDEYRGLTGRRFETAGYLQPPEITHEEAKDALIEAFHQFEEVNNKCFAEHKATWLNKRSFDAYGWYLREVERDLNIIEGWLASIEREFTNLEDEPNASEVREIGRVA